MKFDRNERFVEIYKFTGRPLSGITLRELKTSVKKLHNEINLKAPLNNRLIGKEFNTGFLELNTSQHIEDYINPQELFGITVQNVVTGHAHELARKIKYYEVTPNYIVRVKHGEIVDIYDCISSLTGLNMPEDLNKNIGEFRIVTAIDREHTVANPLANQPKVKGVNSFKEDNSELTFDLEKSRERLNSLGFGPDQSREVKKRDVKFAVFEYPDIAYFKRVDELLEEHAISLLGKEISIMDLALKLEKGEITEQDIINLGKGGR